MRPSLYPESVFSESKVSSNTKNHKFNAITQLWHVNGKCPENTIPIRRTRKQDLYRANSVENFGMKNQKSIPKPKSYEPASVLTQNGHLIEVMYQSSSSTSSSSQRPSLPGGGGGGLIRYGSAPGSLLNSMVDEVIGDSYARDFTGAANYQPPDNFLGHFFTGTDSSSLTSDSTTCGVNSSNGWKQLDRSYGGFNEISQHKSNDVVANSTG